MFAGCEQVSYLFLEERVFVHECVCVCVWCLVGAGQLRMTVRGSLSTPVFLFAVGCAFFLVGLSLCLLVSSDVCVYKVYLSLVV